MVYRLPVFTSKVSGQLQVGMPEQLCGPNLASGLKNKKQHTCCLNQRKKAQISPYPIQSPFFPNLPCLGRFSPPPQIFEIRLHHRIQ